MFKNSQSVLYNGKVDVLSAQKWPGSLNYLSIYAHLSKEYEMQNAERLNATFSKVARK
jgi:hypothetical protein